MARKILCFSLLLLVLSGCSLVSPPALQWVDTTENLQWPPPPDLPRLRYLREVKGAAEQQKNSSTQKFLTWLTGDQEETLPFVTPYGVAVDGK